MKAVKYLLAAVSLAALWVGSIAITLWLWPRLGEGAAQWEKVVTFVIPGLVLLGVTGGWLERFFPLKGRLIGSIGRIIHLFSPGSSFGRSLRMLREWHLGDEKSPHYVEYTRNLEDKEVNDFANKNRFSQWMVAEVVRKYENNVQGFAYLGAGILILFIGLRGLQIIGKSDPLFIVLPLELEFTIIGLLGLLIYYKPEESAKVRVDLSHVMPTREIEGLAHEVREARQELAAERTLEVHIKRQKP